MSYFFFNISVFTLKEWNAMQRVCFLIQKNKNFASNPYYNTCYLKFSLTFLFCSENSSTICKRVSKNTNMNT